MSSNKDLSKKSIGELISMLRPSQLYAFISVIFFLLIGSFGFGRFTEFILKSSDKPIDNSNKIVKKQDSNHENKLNLENRKEVVYLVGSGTCVEYLNNKVNKLFNINASHGLEIHTLKGATGSGINLFLDSYPNINLLVLASDTISRNKLAKYDSNEGFFSVFIGSDPLRTIFIGKDQEDLESIFPSIFSESSERSTREGIYLDELASIVWQKKPISKNKKFDLFITELPSATKEIYTNIIRKATGMVDDKNEYWLNPKPWQTNLGNLIEVLERPSIFLSSEALNFSFLKQLENAQNQKQIKFYNLKVLNNDGKELKRGLYIYGRVSKTVSNKFDGYELSPEISRFLLSLFQELEKANNPFLSLNCINEQRKFFHLDQKNEKAWVSKHIGGHMKYYQVSFKD